MQVKYRLFLKGVSMLKTRLMKAQLILALTAIVVASCGGGNVPAATPTLSVNQIQTRAVATFSSAITLTALAAPTNTLVPTPTITPTVATLSTLSAGTPFSAGGTPGVPVSGGTSCYGLT